MRGRKTPLLSGLLSLSLLASTSTTLTFARSSRTKRSFERDLGFGAVAANAVLYPRVLIATAVLNQALPALVATLIAAFGVSIALQMAALFQVVLMIVHVAGRWGPSGVLASAAVLGLTDVDALTLAMARTPNLPIGVAALAIAIGVASNTALKLCVAVFFGRRRSP